MKKSITPTKNRSPEVNTTYVDKFFSVDVTEEKSHSKFFLNKVLNNPY